MKKILISCGDPSGIGPDLCINLAYKKFNAQITVIGSSKVIYDRARILKKKIRNEIFGEIYGKLVCVFK